MIEYTTKHHFNCPCCNEEMINEWIEPDWPKEGQGTCICDCRTCGWSWQFVVDLKTDEKLTELERYFLG